MDITIYHSTKCGTSRHTLALIRNTGVEPQVIDYVSNAPSREGLKDLIGRAGLMVRDAMLAHPVLINRPFVATPDGVRLCRPTALVLDILTSPQESPPSKEDGEVVIDAEARRVGTNG